MAGLHKMFSIRGLQVVTSGKIRVTKINTIMMEISGKHLLQRKQKIYTIFYLPLRFQKTTVGFHCVLLFYLEFFFSFPKSSVTMFAHST